MKATEGTIGRVFIIRLEEGDMLVESIEDFALQKNISVAHVVMHGSINQGDIVAGPRKSSENPLEAEIISIDGGHEVLATGILVPTKDGIPVLHIHGTLGRGESVITGCLRNGVKIWLVGEVLIYEILGTNAKRLYDEKIGHIILTINE